MPIVGVASAGGAHLASKVGGEGGGAARPTQPRALRQEIGLRTNADVVHIEEALLTVSISGVVSVEAGRRTTWGRGGGWGRAEG